MSELKSLKKKLLYRSNYRGTKELDILLSSFVKKYIDTMSKEQLLDLSQFLDFEDTEIYDFYYNEVTNSKIKSNKVSNMFKKFKI